MPPKTSAEVRQHLIKALQLDLIGPSPEDEERSQEILKDESPSRWYLTGFLVPYEAGLSDRSDPTADDEFTELSEHPRNDDNTEPEAASARKAYFPSSMGLTVLVAPEVNQLTVEVNWGDYFPYDTGDSPSADADETPPSWRRIPKQAELTLTLPQTDAASATRRDRKSQTPIPDSNGLQLVLSVQPIRLSIDGDHQAAQSVSLFLVNQRQAKSAPEQDLAYAFQTQLTVRSPHPFVPRPDSSGQNSHDRDLRIADLHYRDVYEYAVGHNVSATATLTENTCHDVRTTWIPIGVVEKVEAPSLADVELEMEAIAEYEEASHLQHALANLPQAYQQWLDQQRQQISHLNPKNRQDVAQDLLDRAQVVCHRIQAGLDSLSDPQVFDAFRLANRVIARALRQRFSHDGDRLPEDCPTPQWRPFQLAFILTNLRGIIDPNHSDRQVVDLLFFPTGGGKTEAYLGLAAFTLLLRRLHHPGITSAGVSVLMRYTLRLLTLDQLGRAATLICALELERQKDPEKWGQHPFEIGLWVGMSATPNRMGHKGDNNSDSARSKTIAFKNNSRHKPSPIPLENCPWCGSKFTAESFHLHPNEANPQELRINCTNRKRHRNRQPQCVFHGDNPLPIVAVDEQIYRHLPSFLIATVDKFANLPWVGQTAALFGRVSHYKPGQGFYSAADSHPPGQRLPQSLPPPDLIIQDELHLISGPLGTLVGLYETAIEALSSRSNGDDESIPPKIIASTATVRRAEQQIRQLFARSHVDVFPPPGLDRRDVFFARTVPAQERNPRLYLGIAAQGRSLKVVLLRTYLALMAAAQQQWQAAGGKKNPNNPADPYMTLLGYFNSLRELGGSRRIIADEVNARLANYSQRRRVNETDTPFRDRKIANEPLELTSRVKTNEVSETKRRLGLPFHDKEHVDVAIATNMISVGLDITRLGLMVVLGQPKTAAEYIQATSRVGRNDEQPGLVVTLLNVHRPRDRSHYERFETWHESFYRAVEATSVTPFSPRALDRGLAAVVVALARLLNTTLTPPEGAAALPNERSNVDFVAGILAKRVEQLYPNQSESEAQRSDLNKRVHQLLDAWSAIAQDIGVLQYQREIGGQPRLLYDFLDPEVPQLNHNEKRFRAQRSLRDIEPTVNLWLIKPEDSQTL
ncbi:MAG: helicase [Phormidium sp. GEM2.Bin31]|nr:MAG: helicase [Phormidium sp. GEM2.Bin31]